ncbi:BQ2448_6017 [Microbotryum intermedium]|uniref:BQ2448_6017 protein n=1 Tax=Microbotryum intermedium TaxID=269621 RepID=A0A238F5W3_9BASI|nr:BQ2448_6017 [Microbotryum intermedium]
MKRQALAASAERNRLVARAVSLKSTLEAEGNLLKPKTSSTPSVGAGPSKEQVASASSSTMRQRGTPLASTASTSQVKDRPGRAAITTTASRLGTPSATASAPAPSLTPPKPLLAPARKPDSTSVPKVGPKRDPTPVSKSRETSAPKRLAEPTQAAAPPAPVPKPSTAAQPPRPAIRSSTFELVVPVIYLPRKKRKEEHSPRAMVPRSKSISPVPKADHDAIATGLSLGFVVEQNGAVSSASISRTPLSSTSMAHVSTPLALQMDSMVIDTKPRIPKLEMASAPQPVPPVEPLAPVVPVALVALVAPVAPVAPVVPVAPIVPLAPVAPAVSLAPVAAVAPVASVAPGINGRPSLRPIGGRAGIELRNVEPPSPPEMRINPLLDYLIDPAHLLGYVVRPFDANDMVKRKARAPSSVPPEQLPTPSMFTSVDSVSVESFGLRRTQRVAQQALRPCDVPAPFSVAPRAASASYTSSSDHNENEGDDDHSDTEHHFDFVVNTRRGHPEFDRQLFSFEIDYGSDNEEDFAEFGPRPNAAGELEDGEIYTTRWRLDGIDEGRRGITRALEIDAGMNGRFFAAARPTPSAEMIKAWEAAEPSPPSKVDAPKSKKRRNVVLEADSEFEFEDGEVIEDSDSDYAKSHAKSSRGAGAKAKARPKLFLPPPLHRKPTHFASVPDPSALAATTRPTAFIATAERPVAPSHSQQGNEVAAKLPPREPTVQPLCPANRTLPQAFLTHAAHPATLPQRPWERVTSIPSRSRSASPTTHFAPPTLSVYQPNVQTQTQTQRLVGSAPLHPSLRVTVPPAHPPTYAPQPSAFSIFILQRSLSHSSTLTSTPRSSAQASAYKPARDLVRVPMVMERNASPFLHVSALSQRPSPSPNVFATAGSRSAMIAVDPRLKATGVPGIRPTSFARPPIVGSLVSGGQGPPQAEPTIQGGRLGSLLHGDALSR